MNNYNKLFLLFGSLTGLLLVPIVLWYLLLPAPTAQAGNVTVCPQGSPSCDYDTIQAAVDAASSGDVILVQTATYTSTDSQVVYINDNLTLSGGWNAGFTDQTGTSIIDGQDSRRGIEIGNYCSECRIEKFKIQNGLSTHNGAGISHTGGTLTLEDVIIENGYAWTDYGQGGGIFNGGTMNLENCSVKSNESDHGAGGIHNNSQMTINNSTVSGNTCSYYCTGAGIDNHGYLTINNSTISGNTNTSDLNRGAGGITNTGTLYLNNTTITQNSATHYDEGGIYNGETIYAQNTILAGNKIDCNGGITSVGYNLIGDTTGCSYTPGPGDLVNVHPYLAPLYGSPGYHPLVPGSPAINGGDPTGCKDQEDNPLDTDQRGVPRSEVCDIGSYEYDPAYDPLNYIHLPYTLNRFCPWLYHDDFRDPSSGWPQSDDGNILTEYLEEEYRILVRDLNSRALVRSGYQASDYILSVDVRNETGNYGSYGLIFEVSGDWSEFYLFEIDRNGYYRLWEYSTSLSWLELSGDWSASIKTGYDSNHLEVERNGSMIHLYINHKHIDSILDNTYMGVRHLGLAVSTYDTQNVDARFDNFTVHPVTCRSN